MGPELTELITSHTGRITDVSPLAEGSDYSTTAVVTSEQGRVFLKAVPDRPGGVLSEVEREGQINPHLNGLAPALLWQARGAGWFALGFEVIKGRSADFTPGSPDLPRVVQAVGQITALPLPEVARLWVETRWDRALPGEMVKVVRGNHLTHADLHPRNILIDHTDRVWVVDWAWPTVASALVAPSCLAVQLVSSGHDAADVEKLLSASAMWGRLDPDALAVFARADVRMNRHYARIRPGQEWRTALADASQRWAEHWAE
ncbi:hypothetical protein [Nocardiopsis sp. JB363]|uniref:hypothetical protein n=1 Tax=Nocardiopsis sp. JB363 TaxID=1434837 RepID=UPI00097A36B4|nr:hypothetical protein [Nocardiopsis sp. JB363]SIO88494.1 hypothetical protein BQ8420_19205 [Nocardiopsis sp. JB363]